MSHGVIASVADLHTPSFDLTKLITQTTDALLFDHPTAPLQQRAAQIYLALAVAFEQVGLMRVSDAPPLVVETSTGTFTVSPTLPIWSRRSPRRGVD